MADNKFQPMTQGSVPVPDPTVLTTAALLREIANTRELLDTRTASVRETLETRIAGMDKAIVLLQQSSDKMPAFIRGEVTQLQSLHEEKFSSIQMQFKERDTRTEQTSRDNKVAVDAALQAAKEMVGEQNKSNLLANAKQEAAFTKQIDQIGTLLQTMTKSFDDKIGDMKDRLTSIEGRSSGKTEGIGLVGALVLGGVAILGAALGAVSFVNSLNAP